jgi:hypothetical protein
MMSTSNLLHFDEISMSNPQQLVQKLWNYCNILSPARGFGATCRDDGLSYDVAEAERRLSIVEELEVVGVRQLAADGAFAAICFAKGIHRKAGNGDARGLN